MTTITDDEVERIARAVHVDYATLAVLAGRYDAARFPGKDMGWAGMSEDRKGDYRRAVLVVVREFGLAPDVVVEAAR